MPAPIRHEDRCGSLRSLRRFEEATVAIDRALAIAPRSARCWTTKGELQDAQQHVEEALHCFDQALR